MKNIKKGFPPIIDDRATVLILGSMPSEESLRKNEYYGNPRNALWGIMATLFGFAADASYGKRTKLLLKNKVALWDVIQACERQGSLDSAINDEAIVENDFTSFYRRYPNIKYVFFNGAKAEKEYLKRVLSTLPDVAKALACHRLPSTSPAMAALSFDKKLQEWSRINNQKGQTRLKW